MMTTDMEIAVDWIVAVSAIMVVYAVIWLRSGPHAALGVSVLLSFLFPVWVQQSMLDATAGVTTGVAVLALAGFLVHPAGRLIMSLTALDFCVFGMFLVQCFSDAFAEGVTISDPVRAYGEWMIPYVAGRYAVRDEESLRLLSVFALILILFMAFVGVLESITHVNLFELVFGERPLEGFRRDASRFGLKRSYGPALHPIFFGIFQLVFLPWCIPFLSRNVSPFWRRLGIFALVAGVLGVISSLSRGPFLGLLAAAVIFVWTQAGWSRWPLGIIATGMLTAAILFNDPITKKADELMNETSGKLVLVGGELSHMTGGATRFLIFKVYGDAALRAGGLGYGSEATKAYPLNIPHLTASSETLRKLVIENAWLFTVIRNGFLGLFFFLCMFLSGIYSGFCRPLKSSDAPLMAAFGSALTGIALTFMTVWMGYICAFAILWTLGVMSSVVSSQNSRDPVVS